MRKSVLAIMGLLLVLSLCLAVLPAQAAGFTLTVQVQKTGGGLVSVNEGAMAVKVTAKALESGYSASIFALNRNPDCQFTGWIVAKEEVAGDCVITDATNPATTVTSTMKATVEATFSLPTNSTLTLEARSIGGAAVGTVKFTDYAGTTVTLPTGTKVGIEAIAGDANSSFFCWSWNMGFATIKKAVTKFTMCGTAETVTAYFVPLTTDNLKKASYWTYETTSGREDTYRTYTKVAENLGTGIYTSILTSDKPELSCSNASTASLGFPVGASCMFLESGSLQNFMGKTSALYNGRDVLVDSWYWDSTTLPYYYGGPGTLMPLNPMIRMSIVVTTDGYSGTSVAITAPAALGSSRVDVASVSGFIPGEAITITDGALTENNTVALVGPSRMAVAPIVAGPGSTATVFDPAVGDMPYTLGDTVTVADLANPLGEQCLIVAVMPGVPFPGFTTLAFAAVVGNYAVYPTVTLNAITTGAPLINNYNPPTGNVSKPGASGLPYSIGKTWNYVEHQGIFYAKRLQATVMDKELVRVPAGLFECWKVVTMQQDPNTGVGFTLPYRTEWFSEKVHMPVRSEYYIYAQPMQSSNPTGTPLARVQTEVLKKYKLNPLIAPDW